MTLGKLITVLQSIDQNLVIKSGYSNPHSYRGYYHQLALEPSGEEIKVKDLVLTLQLCVNRTFEGYKGGEFLMDQNTTVNIAMWGCTGEVVTGVALDGDGVFLATEKEDD